MVEDGIATTKTRLQWFNEGTCSIEITAAASGNLVTTATLRGTNSSENEILLQEEETLGRTRQTNVPESQTVASILHNWNKIENVIKSSLYIATAQITAIKYFC